MLSFIHHTHIPLHRGSHTHARPDEKLDHMISLGSMHWGIDEGNQNTFLAFGFAFNLEPEVMHAFDILLGYGNPATYHQHAKGLSLSI